MYPYGERPLSVRNIETIAVRAGRTTDLKFKLNVYLYKLHPLSMSSARRLSAKSALGCVSSSKSLIPFLPLNPPWCICGDRLSQRETVHVELNTRGLACRYLHNCPILLLVNLELLLLNSLVFKNTYKKWNFLGHSVCLSCFCISTQNCHTILFKA